MVNFLTRWKRDADRFIDDNREYVRSAGILDCVFFFSCFGDRLWAFSIGLFVGELGGLAWVAIGQLVDSVLKALLLPIVGNILDRTSRHRGMQLILMCNNLSIALSAIFFFLRLSNMFEDTGYLAWGLLAAALLLNALSRVASDAQRAAFMKDWIVAIVEQSGVGTLSTHNTVCSAIDQIAALVSPFIAGLSMSGLSKATTAVIFMVWNLISWVAEAFVIRHLYNTTPALHLRDAAKDSAEEHEKEQLEKAATCSAIGLYFRQKCFRPMFALALLFFTVLGFDNIAIAYGNQQDIAAYVLGAFRAGGGVFGLLGVTAYGFAGRLNVHVVLIGLIGLVLQNVCLSLTTISLWLPGNEYDLYGYSQNVTYESWLADGYTAIMTPHKHESTDDGKGFVWLLYNSPSLFCFFLGIMLARFGLWMADPSVQEIMQHNIPERERYRVNLTQNSIQEFFSILKDVLVIAFPLVATFGGLIVMSVTAVALGLLIYASYFMTERMPLRKELSSSLEDIEMIPKLELKVTEPGVHPELAELLNGDTERGDAPLQTSRTDAL